LRALGSGDLHDCFNGIETAPLFGDAGLRLCAIAILRNAAARDISAGTASRAAWKGRLPNTCAGQCPVALRHAVEMDMTNQGGAANTRQIIA
jgi:hypothetical protein